MKYQVFMVLQYVLRSPMFLGPRFVAASQFTCTAGWLAGFLNDFRSGGAFKPQSNACGGVILRRYLATFAVDFWRCLRKSFIRDFRLGSKYAYAFNIFLTNQPSSFCTSFYFFKTLFLTFSQQSYYWFVL